PKLINPQPPTKNGNLPIPKNWDTLQELNFNYRLPAKQQFGMQFMNLTHNVQPFGSPYSLSETAFQAINKSPEWLQAELSSILAQLEPEKQLLWSNLILSTQDPYVDEIAFCIANSSPQYLNSTFALPELFTENATAIYTLATELPYVEIVDTGNSTMGGNYYSTTSYLKKNTNGEVQQVTVPQEIYYWYIVHPKLTDEIAAYINPTVIENNSTHNNNIATPPTGKFWRTYLYNLQEGDYPVLSDTLVQCQTLFNRDGTGNDAIRTIQWWINQQMSFTSNNERPHQPVRIITKHIGRCGEYADLTAAVARLALIPCTSIISISTDHTWNEFWDENWVAWEPVNGYIDNPLVYENGWGKVFGSVIEIRSDGLLTPVTDRYSEGLCHITIQVVDSNQHPVDGARVVIAILDGSNVFDCDQYTNNNGIVTFTVGESRNYRGRTETTFGVFPAIVGTYTQLVENSIAGENYQFIFTVPAVMPEPSLEELPPPEDPIQDFQFAVSFSSDGYYITGYTLWDDIYSLGSRPYHYKLVETPAEANFMVLDSDNLLLWQLDNIGSGYSHLGPSTQASGTFSIPLGSDWYAIMDNSYQHRNAVKINGSLLFQHNGTQTQDELAPAILTNLSAYPNPFKTEASLSFESSKDCLAEITVYNLKGQTLRSWKDVSLKSGSCNISWDGKDNKGLSVPAGVYIWKVQSGTQTLSSKMLFLK
ncbi:MAG: transglutaminase domain-containing protein, partial [Candidatus Cloacimonas sp.]